MAGLADHRDSDYAEISDEQMTSVQLRIIVGLVSSLVLASCDRRIPVHTSYDKSTVFENYRTYALGPGPSELGQLGQHILTESLRERLNARGLKEVSRDQANLLVVCSLAMKTGEVSSPVGGQTYFPSDFGRYSGTANVIQAPQMREYTHGSLIIDFIDASSRELVFRGIGSAKVNSEKRNAIAINSVVKRVVKDIPRLGGK